MNLESKQDAVRKLNYSPHINFPSSSLAYGPNKEVSIKKTSAAFVGSQRFQEGEQTLNMPSQVVE